MDASDRNIRSSMGGDAVTSLLYVCMSPRVGSFCYIYVCRSLYISSGLRPLQYIFFLYIENIPQLAFRIADYIATGALGAADKRKPPDVPTAPHELNSDGSVLADHWECSALGKWARCLQKPATNCGPPDRRSRLIPTFNIPGDTCMLCRLGLQIRIDNSKRLRWSLAHL